MHALSKMFFFTTGTVGLLILVFIWSALHYGLLSLDHLIHAIINFKLLGYSLPEYLNFSDTNGIGRNIFLLKITLSSVVVLGSCILVGVSYLPRFSWQLRTISFATSLFLLTLLILFWFRLIEGHHIIASNQRILLFSLTLIFYLGGIFTLWYALRPKSRSRKSTRNEETVPLNPVVTNQGRKPSSPEENEASNDEQNTDQVEPVDESKETTDESEKTEEKLLSTDETQETDSENSLEVEDEAEADESSSNQSEEVTSETDTESINLAEGETLSGEAEPASIDSENDQPAEQSTPLEAVDVVENENLAENKSE